jgi:hypothetical protein
MKTTPVPSGVGTIAPTFVAFGRSGPATHKNRADINIVGVQSRNKCSLWNVERKEWTGLFV